MIEDIFGDLNKEGNETNVASLEAAEGKGEESKAAVTEEVITAMGHEGDGQLDQVRRGPPKDNVSEGV